MLASFHQHNSLKGKFHTDLCAPLLQPLQCIFYANDGNQPEQLKDNLYQRNPKFLKHKISHQLARHLHSYKVLSELKHIKNNFGVSGVTCLLELSMKDIFFLSACNFKSRSYMFCNFLQKFGWKKMITNIIDTEC